MKFLIEYHLWCAANAVMWIIVPFSMLYFICWLVLPYVGAE